MSDADILQEYDALRTMCRELADALDAAAGILSEDGIPVEVPLLDRVGNLRVRLNSLAETLRIRFPVPNPCPSLSVLSNTVRTLRGECRSVQWIERLLRIQGFEAIDTGESVREEAMTVREQILEGTSDATGAICQLESGEHPWCALVRLVEERDTLSDHTWEELLESISQSMGNAWTTAIQRRRLFPASLDETADEQEEASDCSSNDSFELPLPNDPDANALLDTPDDEIEREAPDSSDSSLIASAAFLPPQPRCREAATRLLASSNPLQDGSLLSLIRTLVETDQPGLAAHLANCMKSRLSHDKAWGVPSLLQAWTICQSVAFPQGQIAAALAENFHDLMRQDSQPSGQDELFAFQLMVRAVSLRPALIAPRTGAATLLRRIPIAKDTEQVYNYCIRISRYGENTGGLNPISHSPENSQPRYEQAIRLLREEISEWRQSFDKQCFQYAVDVPLFQRTHWTLKSNSSEQGQKLLARWRWETEAVSRVDRLIAPMLVDQPDRIPDISVEAEQLSTFLAGEPDGMDVRDRDQFKSLAKQAIGFAQRWTSLVGGQKNRTTFFSQDHEDLKREIRERFPDVRQEITALIEKSHSPSIALAGRCLLQSLDDVHDRIENATGSDLEEPDPRHLLSGDLLRIPGVRLNASWQPSQSGSALLDTLARAFTEPLPNWEMAIIQHMDQFDLDSVDRILSLNHWTNAERQRWQRWANIRRRHALQENSSASRERTRPAEPVSGRLSDSKVLLEMSAKLAALKQEIEQKKQEQEDAASALDDSTLDLQLNESKPSLRERLRNLATTTNEPRNESTDTSDHSQWIIDLDDGDSQ